MQNLESTKYRRVLTIVLLILILLTAPGIILYIKSHVLPGFKPLPVGPLIVTGQSTPGCVRIVLQDTSFSFNGSKFTGVIELSLFDESQVVTVEDLINNHGVSLVCFNKGIQTAIRIMNHVYSLVNLTVNYYRGVPGLLQGRDVISMFRAREIGAIVMPSISINLWLYGNGYTYTGTSIVSPRDFYMSMGFDYLSAFEKSLEDPFIHIRRGITVIIPPLSELIPKLVELDLKPVIKNLLEKLSPRTLGESNTMSSCIVTPGDACIYNIWGFPDYPPRFWRDRVIIRYATQSPEEVYYWSWRLFISRYGSAHLISKRIFTTLEEVKAYLNSKAYYYEGLHDMDVIIDKAVDPNPHINDLAWNHTFPRGGFDRFIFLFFKPYVIDVSAFFATSVPLFRVTLYYGATGAAYKTSGIAFLGILKWGYEVTYLYSNFDAVELVIPADLNAGARYAALIIPSIMEYLGDYLVLVWEVFDYNSDYWIAIPVPIIIPRYIEIVEFDNHTWQKCYYSANGNVLTPGCTYVTNIRTHLSQLTRYLDRDEAIVLTTQYRNLPLFQVVVVDSSYTNGSHVVDYTLAANAFGIFAWMIGTLFKGTPINPFLSLISTFISYSDLSFRADAVMYKLEIRRISTTDSSVFIIISKSTIATSETYRVLGKVPLTMVYYVYTPPPTIGCPPSIPNCKIPMGSNPYN
jgi:hypothetical protein